MLEVFQNLWFTPVQDKPHLDQETLHRKVKIISNVVTTSLKETGLDWFELLLESVSFPLTFTQNITFDNLVLLWAAPFSMPQIKDEMFENLGRFNRFFVTNLTMQTKWFKYPIK